MFDLCAAKIVLERNLTGTAGTWDAGELWAKLRPKPSGTPVTGMRQTEAGGL
jgi:hypothetical protein